MRKSRAVVREPKPDIKYNSQLLSRFIGKLMLDGKRSTAETIVYTAFDQIKEKTKQEPLEVFETAIKNISPAVEVRARRVGGSTYQIPMEVKPRRKTQLAIRWMVETSRGKRGAPMSQRLANEIMDAAKNEGAAHKKKEDVLKMAEANRAFAHYARY
ncbi:30S ribosomal protein S7, partial [Patescibacteria group bacterium]|nr:30S ribosomal protein S7 [Patescibacteria group bacterium]